MTDEELRNLAQDVRQIRNAQIRPAKLGATCLVILVMSMVSFVALIGLLSVIGRFFSW